MWASIPLVILVILFYSSAFYSYIPEKRSNNFTVDSTTGNSFNEPEVFLTSHSVNSSIKKPLEANSKETTSSEIIAYAKSLIGSPYEYAGISPSGFDCSGFITHVFDNFGIEVPHSSAMQATEGFEVRKNEAKKGDLVIFTGTNLDIREPGHVGIVISQQGEDIEFIHSSSNGGVKISKVEGTRYNQRFLEVRRIL